MGSRSSGTIEHMFEDVVAESREDHGGHVPDDDVDGVVERLLADPAAGPDSDADADPDADAGSDAEAEWDAIPDFPPAEWGVGSSGEPVAAYGSCQPSGWLAL